MKAYLLILVCLVLPLFSIAAVDTSDFSSWTNKDGKEIKALQLGLDLDKQTVKLLLQNGTKSDVPFKNLSDADVVKAKAWSIFDLSNSYFPKALGEEILVPDKDQYWINNRQDYYVYKYTDSVTGMDIYCVLDESFSCVEIAYHCFYTSTDNLNPQKPIYPKAILKHLLSLASGGGNWKATDATHYINDKTKAVAFMTDMVLSKDTTGTSHSCEIHVRTAGQQQMVSQRSKSNIDPFKNSVAPN